MLNRIHKALIRRLPRPRALLEVPVRFGTHTFRSPVINGEFCDVSEAWMTGLLGIMLPRRGGTFIDAGVNLGQTLLAVKGIDPARTYLGFEPNPQCFAYCELLVRLNEMTGVTLVPVGIGAETKIARLQLYGSGGTDPAASLVDGFRPGETVTGIKMVPVFTYNEVARAVTTGTLGIVKIDVEGAESEVLAGMSEAIARDRPWISVEILPCYRADNTERIARQQTIEALMQRLDYRLMRVRKSADGAFGGLEPIEEIGIHGEIARSDYVFCPREDQQALLAAAAAA